jgi:hypothetical protein
MNTDGIQVYGMRPHQHFDVHIRDLIDGLKGSIKLVRLSSCVLRVSRECEGDACSMTYVHWYPASLRLR